MASRILARLNRIETVYQIDACGNALIQGEVQFSSFQLPGGAELNADASGLIYSNRQFYAPSIGIGSAANKFTADGSNNIVSSRTVSAPGMILSGWKFSVDGSGNLVISL